MRDMKLGERVLRGIWAGLLVLALGVGITSMANAQSQGTIRIAENDWTGNLVDINLAKIVLEEEMGYDVELVFADYTGQWAGLAAGDLDVAMELWYSYSADAQREWLEEKKKVEKIGDLGVVGTGGWFVPTYVINGDPERGIEPMAPDLESVQDLNKYKDLFARPETEGKGFLLDAIAGWDSHNADRINAFGLDYRNVFAGSEGGVVAEIEGAYARGEPLLTYLWAPHWLHAKYDLTELQMPEYTDACYGVGTDAPGTFDCDFPSEMTYNIARVGFKDEYPEAYQFFKNMWLTTEQQQEMLYAVDVMGKSVEEAVRGWMAKNEDVWRAWIPQ